jgi:hypothetical protein
MARWLILLHIVELGRGMEHSTPPVTHRDDFNTMRFGHTAR